MAMEHLDLSSQDASLVSLLLKEGYWNIREIEGRGYVGLYRFIFTTGLVFGMDETEYVGRYCYANRADAEEALREWNGIGDPSGPWIKYKGVGGERSGIQ